MKRINELKARLNSALDDFQRIAKLPGDGIAQAIAQTALNYLPPPEKPKKRFPRGKCPICGRVRSMNKHGWLRGHGHDGEGVKGIPLNPHTPGCLCPACDTPPAKI